MRRNPHNRSLTHIHSSYQRACFWYWSHNSPISTYHPPLRDKIILPFGTWFPCISLVFHSQLPISEGRQTHENSQYQLEKLVFVRCCRISINLPYGTNPDLGSFLRGSFHQPTFKSCEWAGETNNSQPQWTMEALRGNDKKSIGRCMNRGEKSKPIREDIDIL